MAGEPRRVRVFVSSPGDASFERARLERVTQRLNGEFQGVAELVPIRWETEFYKAHETFQAQIPEAAQCEIVVAIFRGRLGTELPADFPRMPNGEPYPSGTAYEVLSAIEGRKEHSFPDVFVFRYPQPPSVQLDDRQRPEIESQWERLKSFFNHWFKSSEGQFKAAFHSFESTDDFENQVEALLRKWLEENVLHGRSVLWPIAIKGSPFRGLAAFGAKHAAVFFGRSRDLAKAVDRLKDAAEAACPFLLVDGPSGAGKSSFVRAGLVPRLTAAGMVPSVDIWRVAIVQIGERSHDPFLSLAEELFVAESDLPEHERGRPPALPELRQGDFSREEDLAELLAHADQPALKPIIAALAGIEQSAQEKEGYERTLNAKLLLVIDQLDELFGSVAEDVQTRFGKLLNLLVRSGHVWLIATFRADLFDKFLAQADLRQLKGDGASFDLTAPDVAELAEIVRAPAEAANLVYGTDKETGERLDERLLKDADRSDLLPLLQFTLEQLFEAREQDGQSERLTFSAYRQLGGIEGAVEKQADAAFSPLSEVEKERLPRLLRILVVPARDGGGSTARTGINIQSVPYQEAAYDEPSERLVRALVNARILLSTGEGERATVRLAHTRVIDSWKLAREIVAENADFYRIRAEVEEQRRRWEVAGRRRDLLIGKGLPLAEAEQIVRRFPEEVPAATRDFVHRSGRRARLLQTMTLAAAAVFLVIAVVAAVEWRYAVAARQQAEQAHQIAEVQRRHAEQALTAATRTANGLIFNLAQRFRHTLGVPASLIKDILDRARALQEQLISSGQNTPQLRRSEAVALGEIATTLLTIGDTKGALMAAEKARRLFKALLTAKPTDAQRQRDLSIANETVGNVLIKQGKLDAALAAYHVDVAIAEKLAAADPHNNQRQRDLAVAYNEVGDVLNEQGKLGKALKAYHNDLALMQRLTTVDRSKSMWQRALSVTQIKIGDVLKAQGKLDHALAFYRKALAIRKRLAAADRSSARPQRDLSVVYEKIGDTQVLQGHLAMAQWNYRQDLAIAERLAATDRSNTQWQRDLSVGYERIGNVLVAQGKLAEAIKIYRKDLAIAQRLAAADPHNLAWQRDLSVGYEKVGDLLIAQGHFNSALTAYHKDVAIVEHLAAVDRANADWQRDMAVAYGRLGSALVAQQKLDDALDAYHKALTTMQHLVSVDHGNLGWQRDLAVAHNNVGAVLRAKGKLVKALGAYRDSLAIIKRLLVTNSDNTTWQRDLSLTHGYIGGVLKATGKLDEALKAYGEALAAMKRLVSRDPNNAQWQNDLATSYINLGDVLVAQNNLAAGLDAYRNSLTIRERLAGSDRSNLNRQRDLALAYARIGDVLRAQGKRREAIEDYHDALAIVRHLVVAKRDNLLWQHDADILNQSIGDTLVARGKFDDALAAYRASLVFSKRLAAADHPNVEREREPAIIHSKMAMAYLKESKTTGALGELRKGRSIIAALAMSAPDNQQWKHDLAVFDSEIALIEKRQERVPTHDQ